MERKHCFILVLLKEDIEEIFVLSFRYYGKKLNEGYRQWKEVQVS